MPNSKIQVKKCLIALVGLPLVGKSFIGQELARQSNFIFYDVDETRLELYPKKEYSGPEREKEIMLESYQHNHKKAQQLLSDNKPVILAATYSRETYHEMLKKLARESKTPLKVFYLYIPDDQITQRIKKRLAEGSTSNITNLDTYLSVKNRYQLITDVDLLKLDTSLPLQETIETIWYTLKQAQLVS